MPLFFIFQVFFKEYILYFTQTEMKYLRKEGIEYERKQRN